MRKDMTEAQFLDALKRYGMSLKPFMGYVGITDRVSVSRHNGGDTRREQLAYLIRQQKETEDE